jgi:hypothetical protein
MLAGLPRQGSLTYDKPKDLLGTLHSLLSQFFLLLLPCRFRIM